MRPKKLYYFKNESYGDDWQEIESAAFNEESLAYEVAEEYWSDDPCDPHRFEFYIEVKLGESGAVKKYNVTAEADVNFYAREIE